MAKNKGLHISRVEFNLCIEQYAKLIDSGFDTTSIASKELNSVNHQTRFSAIVSSVKIEFDVYYNKDNTITVCPLGNTQSKTFGEGLIDYILERNSFRDVLIGSFSCYIEESVYLELKTYLLSLKGIDVLKDEDKGSNGIVLQIISDIGDKITLTYYSSTKKLLFQGNLMNLHVETKAFLDAYNAYVKTDVAPIHPHNDSLKVNDTVDSLIKTHLPCSYINLAPLLQDLLYDALTLVVMRIEFKDYGTWVFPALKALEGRIKQIFGFHGISIDSKKGFSMFDFRNSSYMLKSIVPISDVNTKACLSDCYSFFAKHRHQLFHTMQTLEASRRLERPEAAEDIIFETCKLIEDSYCKIRK